MNKWDKLLLWMAKTKLFWWSMKKSEPMFTDFTTHEQFIEDLTKELGKKGG